MDMATKMEDKLENLFLNRAKFVMKVFGVWLPPIEDSFPRKCHRHLVLTLQYILLTFQFIYIFQVWGDLEAVTQALYVLFTQACLCFKVTVFHVNKEILRELLDQMNSHIFKPKTNVHEMILKGQAIMIKRFLFVFLISAQTTCALWALKPLFDDAGSRKFPLDMWMPVTPDTSPQYELGFAFQLVTICMSAYMYFGVDSVTLSLLIFARAQIDIIKYKIMSVQHISSVNHMVKAKERQKMYSDNHKILVECVTHHQAVVTFSHKVEDAYHSYLLFQLAGSVAILGMTALRLLVVDWQSMQFLSIVSYLFVMLCQLYACCWCGHELTVNSEELRIVMYKCAWYEQDVKFQRDLCFAIVRMNRPMVLRAGHYITLSRQTFLAVSLAYPNISCYKLPYLRCSINPKIKAHSDQCLHTNTVMCNCENLELILRMSYSYFAVLNQAHKD